MKISPNLWGYFRKFRTWKWSIKIIFFPDLSYSFSINYKILLNYSAILNFISKYQILLFHNSHLILLTNSYVIGTNLLIISLVKSRMWHTKMIKFDTLVCNLKCYSSRGLLYIVYIYMMFWKLRYKQLSDEFSSLFFVVLTTVPVYSFLNQAPLNSRSVSPLRSFHLLQ